MNKDKETLVILIPGFPESETDSTCLPSQQSFVRSLKEIYPQLNIVVLTFQYPYHQNPYKWYDIEVIPFSGRNKGGLSRLLLRRKINATLRHLNSNHKIIGLLSFWFGECAVVGKRFGRRFGIPHYNWIRGQDAKKENKYPKRLSPSPGELIALSDFLQDEFEKNHGIRPAHVIPPGIDARHFSNPLPVKNIDLLAVASLIPLKQFDIFLRVVDEIKKKIPIVEAVLVGNGPEKRKLENMVREMGLEANIIITGELTYPETLQRMQQAKILVHPSSYEGFSGVCLEALHAGAIVISFCKAMNFPLENWHTVSTIEEMTKKTLEILQNTATVYKQVTPYTAGESVKKIMQLFSR